VGGLLGVTHAASDEAFPFIDRRFWHGLFLDDPARRLPFSEMKVARSFVMNASNSEESRMVTKSIVDLGHGLGLTVTAEGVEDVKALEFLRDIGCDLAQGYYISRRMWADQARSYLNTAA
jgi:EAL domain-containing protein (putative c-di-GMP-specific phosphodiesterase class I)